MPDNPICSDQMYESCQPTAIVRGEPTHTRIKVVGAIDALRLGYSKVDVVTVLPDGREVRRRMLAASQLHATGTTRTGQPRRTGYRLVQDRRG